MRETLLPTRLARPLLSKACGLSFFRIGARRRECTGTLRWPSFAVGTEARCRRGSRSFDTSTSRRRRIGTRLRIDTHGRALSVRAPHRSRERIRDGGTYVHERLPRLNLNCTNVLSL